jgi:hypothetical protein
MDLWIVLVMLGSVFMFVPLIPFVPEDERWILYISMAVMAVIILPFFYGYVELSDEYLRVRLGIFRQTIYYKDIKSVRLCTNFLSSLAMTSQRIEIKVHGKGYVRGTTFIGPKEREEVYQELLYRCPNIEQIEPPQ